MDLWNKAYDIIIQAGQSNAEGCGRGDVTEEYIPDPDIVFLHQDFTLEFPERDGQVQLVINYLYDASMYF